MIQRIQSLYLFGAFILNVLMFFIPVLRFLLSGGELYYFYIFGIFNPENNSVEQSTIPLIILLVIISLINVLIIFLFKKRVLQIRLCIYNMLLLIGLVILIIFYIYSFLP